MTFKRSIIFLITIFFCLNSVAAADEVQKNPPYSVARGSSAPVSSIKVINMFPHDSEAFTQGLLYHDGYLYESTGLYGKSALRKVLIKSGKAIQEFRLDSKYFAEGIVISGSVIYQLIWRSDIVFVYDLSSFKLLNKISYPGGGWGITSDGKNLFISNGTAVIDCIDPENFRVVHKISVYDGKTAVGNLNELEFIRGEIWANIFTENVIARISPQTGRVLGWVDLSRLHDLLPGGCRADVLNGIAYDQENDRIFVTGKLWPKIFEIRY